MIDPLEKRERVKKYTVVIQEALERTFEKGDWIKLGYETDSDDCIQRHPRLLRSLQWGDDDYGGCIFEVLDNILRKDIQAFKIIIGNEKIKGWLKKNKQDIFNEIYEEAILVPSFTPIKIPPKKAVLQALEDAETLISAGKPVSAVDRIHTALHGYLQDICAEHGIICPKDASITKLFKMLREDISVFGDTGTRSEDVKRILNSFATCIDALNPIRNHGSMAHPNESLLAPEEATLVINATSTILHYLEAKIHK